MNYFRTSTILVFLFGTTALYATIFGSISGLIHDPQHRPVEGATVTIRAENSDWTKSITSDSSGEFRFEAVPLGRYKVRVELTGFSEPEQYLTLTSGRDARLHFALAVAQAKETVQVTDTAASVNPQSSTTQSVISRQQIASAPGAHPTNRIVMIT